MLTREHAPPQAVKGRRVVLTCDTCNTKIGKELDQHLANRERLREFASAEMTAPIPAWLEIDGVKAEVDVLHTQDALGLSELPTEMAQKVAALAAQGSPFDISLTFHRTKFEEKRALLSWLRAAYLLAFAALGYRYILRRPLKIVRENIRLGNNSQLRWYSVTLPDAARQERHIYLILDSIRSACLAVQWGQHLVFLPWDDDGIYDQLAADPTRNAGRFNATLNGKEIPWPDGPAFMLDFA